MREEKGRTVVIVFLLRLVALDGQIDMLQSRVLAVNIVPRERRRSARRQTLRRRVSICAIRMKGP